MNPKARHSRSFCTLDNPQCNHSVHSIVPSVSSQDSEEESSSCSSNHSSLLPLKVAKKVPQTAVKEMPSSSSPPDVQITATGKSMTLVLSHAGKSQVITLPTDKLDQNKKYRATFTVKKIEYLVEEKSDKNSSVQEDRN